MSDLNDASQDPQQQQQDPPLLSTTSIAIICACVAVGLGLVLVTFILIRRRRNQRNHGFVTFDDESKPERVPPPETHDLVFSSILAHTPRPPVSSHGNNSSRVAGSINDMRDSAMLQDGYSYTQLYMDRKTPSSKPQQPDGEVSDPKLLLSLARQRESWAGYYSRPSTPQPSGDRLSSGSSYQVW